MKNIEGEAYEFPGAFEISAMGAADAGIAEILPDLVESAGAQVLAGTLRTRSSSGGNYVAVHLNFLAASREQLDAVYDVVRENPAVRWIL